MPPFVTTRMVPEDIVLCEVSWTEKYHMIPLVAGIYNSQMNRSRE